MNWRETDAPSTWSRAVSASRDAEVHGSKLSVELIAPMTYSGDALLDKTRSRDMTSTCHWVVGTLCKGKNGYRTQKCCIQEPGHMQSMCIGQTHVGAGDHQPEDDKEMLFNNQTDHPTKGIIS